MAAFSRNPAGRTLTTIPNHAVSASETRTASSLSAFCEENLSSVSVLPMNRVWDARRFSPRRHFGPRSQSLIVPILFQITVQTGLPDSQHLRRPRSISFACLPCSGLTQLGRAQNFIRINRFVAKASIGPYT